MESVKEMLQDKLKAQRWIDGVILVKKPQPGSALLDHTDYFCLVVVNDPGKSGVVQYYLGTFLVQEHRLTLEALNQWVMNGTDRRVMSWLLYGELLFDRSFQITVLIRQLNQFPVHEQQVKVCAEFSRFLRRYKQAKDDLSRGQVLDAFRHVLALLDHWAKTVILKSGHHPELTLWDQVKDLNIGVYRLYEELVSNQEEVEKRLELILLGAEFTMITKIKENAQFLLALMTQGEKKIWTYEDLMLNTEVKDYHVDVGALLEKLVQKQIVQQTMWVTNGQDGNAYYAYVLTGVEAI